MAREQEQLPPLHGDAYRSPEAYDSECEQLFPKTWISVTTGMVVPEPGDVFPCTVAGLSLLVVRGRDHEIRVFYNLCRHRGAPLLTEPCRQTSGLLTCPYHAWSYRLDGQLYKAPHFDRLDAQAPTIKEQQELGLIQLRSALWRDIVFINIDGQADPFEAFIAPLDARLAPWSAELLQPLGSKEYDIQANWKLVAENFIDAWHLPFVHPELTRGMAPLLAVEDVRLNADLFGFVMPQGYGERSGVEHRATPVFPDLPPDRAETIEVWCIFPNTLILVEPDNQQVITVRPQSATHSHETFADYLPGAPVSEAERESMLAFSQHINEQDKRLLEAMQPARAMPVGDQTQLNRSWDQAVSRFQLRWRQCMDAAGKDGTPPASD